MERPDFSDASEVMADYEKAGQVRVEIGWIGEGVRGDFVEEDPEDVPLLRFDAYDLAPHEDTTECTGRFDCCRGATDNSYCTNIPAWVPVQVLQSVCKAIALDIYDLSSWKRPLEGWSWLNEEKAFRLHEELRTNVQHAPKYAEGTIEQSLEDFCECDNTHEAVGTVCRPCYAAAAIRAAREALENVENEAAWNEDITIEQYRRKLDNVAEEARAALKELGDG